MTGDVGKSLDSREGSGIKDTGFVVVSDEDIPTAGEDGKEGVEIVRVGTVEPLHEWRVSSGRPGKNLESGDGRSVGAILTTNHKNRAVRQEQGTRIPSTFLKTKLLIVLLPLGSNPDAWRSRGLVETNTKERVGGPTTNVDLSATTVG